MRRRFFKRLGAFVFLIIFLVVGLRVVLPLILSPENYKSEILAQFEKSTGYSLTINGEINLHFLPLGVEVSEVFVDNPNQGSGKHLLAAKRVVFALDASAMFTRKVRITEAVFTSPEINLETMEGGAKSWENETLSALGKSSGGGKSISVGEIRITDGTVNITDRENDSSRSVSGIDASFALGSMRGPFQASGSFVSNGVPLKGSATLGNLDSPKTEISLDVSGGKSEIKLEGAISGEKSFSGKLAMRSSDAAVLAKALGLASTFPENSAISVSSSINYEQAESGKAKALLENAEIEIGETKGSGKITADLKNAAAGTIAASMKFSKINLDELLSLKPPSSQTETKKRREKEEDNGGYALILNLSAGEVVYSKKSYRDLEIESNVEGGTIIVQPAKISVPGNGRLELFGSITSDTGRPRFEGDLSLSTANLAETLEGLGLALKTPDKKTLGKGTLKSNLIASSELISLSNAKAAFDETNIVGEARFSLKKKELSATFRVDSINLDRYLPEKKTAAAPSPGDSDSKAFDFSWLRTLPLRLAVVGKAGSVKFSGDTYSDLSLNMEAGPGSLKLNDISASSAKVNVSGRASVTTGKDGDDIQADLRMGDVDLGNFIKSGGAEQAPAPKGGNHEWSSENLNLPDLSGLSGKINLSLSSLKKGQITLSNVETGAELDSGTLKINSFTAGAFDGYLSLRGNLVTGEVPGFSMSYVIKDANIKKALRSLSGIESVDGITGISGNLASSGLSQRSMIEQLQGKARIDASGVTVTGFDLQSFTEKLVNIENVLDLVSLGKITVKGGVTKLNKVQGDVSIVRGVVSTPGIKHYADTAEGTTKGEIDLPKWHMELSTIFRLIIGSYEDKPGLGVLVSGPPDAPQLSLDTRELEPFVARKAAGKALKLLDNKEGAVEEIKNLDPKKLLKGGGGKLKDSLKEGLEGLLKK